MNKKYQIIAKENSEEFNNFKRNIFPAVMLAEGGGKLHNVAKDTGGQTIWGIAYNKNKADFDNLADHANTTEEEAAAFAFVKYYLPLKPNLIPKSAKLYAFDMAYNMGVGQAKMYIQKSIGVVADGIFGKQTEAKLPTLNIDSLHKLRVDFYNDLGKKPDYSRFLKGWLNRANSMYKQSK